MCMNLLDMTIRLTMVACALLAASRDVHVPSSPPSPRLRRVLAVALRAEAAAALTHFPVSASQPTMTFPEATISNGQITAKIYLPDPQRGFYRSTRFDWSGMIASLEHNGHQYYGPWFTGSDPSVRDFVYRGQDIVVSAQSGAVGPAEEFQRPLGYSEAKSGETFVKIGVGVLRKKAASRTALTTPTRSSTPASGRAGRPLTPSSSRKSSMIRGPATATSTEKPCGSPRAGPSSSSSTAC